MADNHMNYKTFSAKSSITIVILPSKISWPDKKCDKMKPYRNIKEKT